ncbi:MAG: hypothetical protein WDN06_08065 [Asticcacaulis sp.]
MIYVWIQSLVILSLVFGGGLWFGGALSKWTEKPVARAVPVQPLAMEAEAPAPVYHGFAVMPEPDVAVAVQPEARRRRRITASTCCRTGAPDPGHQR